MRSPVRSAPSVRWKTLGLIIGRLRLCALLALVLALPTGATLVPTMSVEQMIDDSEVVVHGKVWRTWAAWDDAHQNIWTHYEILVADVLKGSVDGKFVVSEPGGTVGELSMAIAGTPGYQVGEEVVVFAVRTPIGLMRTCGWGQGQFAVVTADGSSEKVMLSPRLGVELVDSVATRSADLSGATSRKALHGLPLNEFKAQLGDLIRARAGREGR